MPVYRDERTGSWFFKTTVRFADGTKKRISGTPGSTGTYHDLAPSRVGAQEAERRAIVDAMHGRPHAAAPVAKETPKTIKEHAETFVDTYKPGSKPSVKREKRRILKTHLLPIFGAKKIEDLKQLDIDAFAKSELDRGLTIKTVNEYLAVLSTLIRYVQGEKPKHLRFKLDGMMGEITAVASADVEKLLERADDVERAIVLLAAEAGLRVGEIRGLQWTDLKGEQITIRRALDRQTDEIIAPKHNKPRTVPMSPRLVSALASLPRLGLWVIAESDGSLADYELLSGCVNALYDRAGVERPKKPMHCLRHTYGTVMARRVPLPVVQKLMGHSDIATTMRYVDVSEDDKREAVVAVFGAAVSATCPQASDKSESSR